ncbi:MAG: hypothetical protein ACLPXW_15290 [Xanthobacteraceae bacterium]
MLRTIALATALTLIAIPMVSAQVPKQPPPVANPMGQGDARERAACHPDVVRYCKQLIKDDANADVFGILNYLQANRQRISKACNQVLVSHGQ